MKFIPESELKVGGKFEGGSSYIKDFNSKQVEKL
jgi:hypothetical protein